MRINKYIASCGICSRRKAEELILQGKVKVNGVVVYELSTIINNNDKVEINNKEITLQENYIYLMINKPKGYVSTASDDRGRKTVLDLVPSNMRVYPVGRLDYNSEGLLLLTNDGDLTNKLTHPKHSVGKTYSVKVEGIVSAENINKIREGIYLDGQKLRQCEIFDIKQENNFTKLKITIYEGKNRQIRRMFEQFNHQVVFLKRIAIGTLKLGGLNRGEVRKLTNSEVAYLKLL